MAKKVAVVMGSVSDWDIMQHSVEILKRFSVPYQAQVVSAHRTPDLLFHFAETAEANGFVAIIAGAGGAAHLPGMLAAKTLLPVLGVPIPVGHLQGQDALYSIVQMPKGVPVATFAIGMPGAVNAALFSVQLQAVEDGNLAESLAAFRAEQRQKSLSATLPDGVSAC